MAKRFGKMQSGSFEDVSKNMRKQKTKKPFPTFEDALNTAKKEVKRQR